MSPNSATPSEGESDSSAPVGGTYFLGRYRVVDEIGVGGMASVHLARADGPGGFQKWVAIKRIHQHLAEDEQFIQMFLDEARIAARISHPNVAQVFDLGRHRGSYWIAMEYLHGEPLRELMRAVEEAAAPAMGPHLAARMIADAAEGLHAAHELRGKDGALLNLVHRDVTPHNVFLTYEGAVKIVDFGIAKVAGRLVSTRAGTLKGKLAYMSPEQVRGAAIDRRTDIFALGVVLWESTVGRRLFRADSDLETLERVQSCRVPRPSSLVPSYPPELEAIVMRALARDLSERYATARELSRALQGYLMRCGRLVGPEELGAYVKHTLSARYETREEHLRWAAEVTQTVALEDIEGSGRALDEVSLLTYSSDVMDMAEGSDSSPTPAQEAAPRSDRSTPAVLVHPTARRAFSVPLTSTLPLAAFESASQASAQSGSVGFGPVQTPAPFSMSAASPGAEIEGSASIGASGHGFDDEMSDDVVTRVMVISSDAERPRMGSISTIHTPPKSYQPEPLPAAPVVVQEAAIYDPFSAEVRSFAPRPYGVAPPGMSPAVMVQVPAAYVAPTSDRRAVVIAVIAAVTTLMALALVAFVVLRLTSPQRQEVAASNAGPAAPTSARSSMAASVPVPAPAPSAALPKQEEGAAAESRVTAESRAAGPRIDRRPPKSVARSVPSSTQRAADDAQVAAEPGFLTLVCNPACDNVIVGDRDLGPSPVVRASLPPGTHSVSLRKAGVASKSISVKILSGQTTARRVATGS